MTKKFQDELDSLLDIAEKPNGRYSAEKGIEYLRNSMRQHGKKKGTGFALGSSAGNESDYEDDLKFYIDQKGPTRKTLGPSILSSLIEKRKRFKVKQPFKKHHRQPSLRKRLRKSMKLWMRVVLNMIYQVTKKRLYINQHQ